MTHDEIIAHDYSEIKEMPHEALLTLIKPQYAAWQRRAVAHYRNMMLGCMAILSLLIFWPIDGSDFVCLVFFYVAGPMVTSFAAVRRLTCLEIFKGLEGWHHERTAETAKRMNGERGWSNFWLLVQLLWAFVLPAYYVFSPQTPTDPTSLLPGVSILVIVFAMLGTLSLVVASCENGKLNPVHKMFKLKTSVANQTSNRVGVAISNQNAFDCEREYLLWSIVMYVKAQYNKTHKEKPVAERTIPNLITLGKKTIPIEHEPKHITLAGAVGSGKSTAIFSILETVRKRGQRAIVYDKAGEFTSRFYREGIDVIINPFDERGANWHPLVDARSISDFRSLAERIIPEKPGSKENPYFINAPRAGIMAALRNSHGDIHRFMEFCVSGGPEMMEKAIIASGLKNTQGSGDSQANVLSTIATAVERWNDFVRPPSDRVFSIRDFVLDESHDSWIFLTSSAEHHASLLPLIGNALDVSVNAAMRLPDSEDRRLWVILDELPTLGRLDSLPILLKEARKFGVCSVLGYQSVNDIFSIYGKESGSALIGQPWTRLILKIQDAGTAKALSEEIGEERYIEHKVSYTTGSGSSGKGEGANTSAHNSVSRSQENVTRHAILGSQLQGLKPLEGYLRIDGQGVSKIKLIRHEMPRVAASFVRRPEADAFIHAAPQPSTSDADAETDEADTESDIEANVVTIAGRR